VAFILDRDRPSGVLAAVERIQVLDRSADASRGSSPPGIRRCFRGRGSIAAGSISWELFASDYGLAVRLRKPFPSQRLA